MSPFTGSSNSLLHFYPLSDKKFSSEMANSYDVFLNFSGKEIRGSFVDHLYTALVQKGFMTLKNDDEEEESGTALKAIEESKCAIVIFSRSYASSSRCLDELVKIMECSKSIGQIVMPIFDYDFNLSDLLKQGRVFGKLFGKYEYDKVRAWSEALVEAASLPGTCLNFYKYEAMCINEIVEMVSRKLGFSKSGFHRNQKGMEHDKLGIITSSGDHGNLIGMERRVREVKALLGVRKGEFSSKSVVASSSPPSSRWTYDVLISFRRNDTCKDFVDQLYCALDQKGIYTLRDNPKLFWNESFPSELLKAFEESCIAVVIFSKNYAASSWCLDELVKIMKCNEEIGQIVLPVFYDVDPSDVRNQNGIFGKTFMQQQTEKVELWRKALVQAGSLAGWHLNHTPKSHEATIIKSVVDTICRRLVPLPYSIDTNLIGIEPRMKHVVSLLKLKSGGVRMLGIWGMAGVGKTTIARAVFNQIFKDFDGSCFAGDIREVSVNSGLEIVEKEVISKLLMQDNLEVDSLHEGTSLIRNRLCNLKVLLVLDDVDHKRQLESLAGSCSWFGEGSRIIITTRDEHLLVAHNVKEIYNVNELSDEESIQFLTKYAFNEEALAKGYEDLLLQVVRYAAGLPLVLKVLSSLLCGKSKKEWISTLARLQTFPEKGILDKLKISFDGLDGDEKDIFLDIACFFNGADKDRLVRILDSCGFAADDGLRVLEQKSLIRISDERVHMHDLLQQMGREIVRQRHPDEPQKRSRLWHAEEVCDILREGTGTEDIGAIVVDDFQNQEAVDMSEAFMTLRGMKKLKLLQINSHNISSPLQGPIYLPNELRWLSWQNCPLQSLPASFEASNLVGLELLGSSIVKPWNGIKLLGNLHFLDLSYSKKLISTPDFTWTPNLEKLVLEHCSSLVKVHKSIGSLRRLSFLSLRSCKSLETLPSSILQLESLEILDIKDCSNLKRSRLMSNLVKFYHDSHMIKVPSSIDLLQKFQMLQYSNLRQLKNLPDDIKVQAPPNFVKVCIYIPKTSSRYIKKTNFRLKKLEQLEYLEDSKSAGCEKTDVDLREGSSGSHLSSASDFQVDDTSVD